MATHTRSEIPEESLLANQDELEGVAPVVADEELSLADKALLEDPNLMYEF